MTAVDAFDGFLAAAKEAGLNLEELSPVESRQSGAFLATQGGLPVPFWSHAEDVRNRAVENVVIEHFTTRPNTLSLRDVRDASVPWSIEVVGRRRTDIQHIRILCEHESQDVLNLPFELRREGKDGYAEADGWGINKDVDFLIFVSARTWIARLVGRDRFEAFVAKSKSEGINYPHLNPRKIPYDPFDRAAFGQLVPIADLEHAGVILDTWIIRDQEDS